MWLARYNLLTSSVVFLLQIYWIIQAFFTSSGTFPATNAVGYPVEQCCESKYRTLNLDMDPGFWPNLNPDLGLRYQF